MRSNLAALVVLTAVLALVLAFAPPLDAQQNQATEADEYIELPDKAGRDEVVGICGACHSLKLVVQQRLPRHRWEELMVWMTEKQGMPKLPPEDEKLIVDYLVENLGPPPARRPKF
ncbi:MAG: hypothetical protein L6R19_05380 [Alphaproteobacteria bacterium]|nr:hypothetical protein [Alphaproteobacteria bacterium]